MPFILACTSFDKGTYYAIVQESAIVYIQGYSLYILTKNGLARWSDSCSISSKAYIHVCQHLYIDIQCITMSVY